MSHNEILPLEKSSENAAFLRLFAATQPHLFAYIYTLLPNWNDAEEVLQETSLVLWRSFSEYEQGTNFKAWACKTAFYQVLSFRKRQKRKPVLMSREVVEAVAEESADLTDLLDEQLRALAGCINKLQPRDRNLLDRFYGLGISVKLIAEQLERPVGTITKSLTRVRRTLFACIEQTLAMEKQG